MSEMTAPETVLADWRSHARILEARGHAHDATILRQCATEIAPAIACLTTWMSEADAMLQSGRGPDYFRHRFTEWASAPLPLAEMRGKRRWYRAVVVPQRKHASAAKLAGLRGERAG